MFQAGRANPKTRIITNFAAVAQSVERVLGKDEVGSSNLLSSLMFSPLKPSKIIGVAVKIAVNFRGSKFCGKHVLWLPYLFL